MPNNTIIQDFGIVFDFQNTLNNISIFLINTHVLIPTSVI